MKTMFLRSTALIALAIPSVAHAQSTGSIEFDEPEIVVTAGTSDIGGIEIPNTTKAKQVVTEDQIRRARPGQTINDIVNLVPGVSFQNNDPWGSSGGGFTVRGFGADRVSQTLDGLPLNDSGNYALYTNQQVDSEVLESVNVNLGTTDVDSPTASAAGGTINIRTREPKDYFHITSTMSVGDVLAGGASDTLYMRGFGMIDTGDITGSGTKAFASVSYTRYGVPYNPYGQVDKTQVNGRIWQDLGSNGDFISVSGHFNQNRNNFAGSERLSDLLSFYDGGFTKEERFSVYENTEVYPCAVDPRVVIGGGGSPGESVDYSDRGGCGSAFFRRYNPSDTGNIRGASRFSVGDSLTLTVDPSYQYVKANGGGPDDLRESLFTPFGGTQGLTGAFNGGYYFGRDLNNDGDLDDEVAGNDPSQTITNRYGVVANAIYDINSDHRVRIAYTWDRARHRQTGQITNMLANGEISDVFAIDNPLLAVDGLEVNKRDRKSFAILHQVSGEYRGRFGGLTAVLGLRAPFFTRDLNQNCYTTSINGFVDCPNPGQDLTEYEALSPDHVGPVSRTYKYDDLLPNVGFTYDFDSGLSVFANYAKGLSVPGTDPLYDSLYLINANDAQPVPETTNSFDAGLRYNSGRITAQVAGWFTGYNDRLASAFDPDANMGEGATVFRNLGKVDKYGIDGSIAYRPTRQTLLYVFGSLSESEIQDDVQDGVDVNDDPIFLATAGNRESGTPTWSVGARGQVAFGNVEMGAQVKHTGKRYINDLNTDTAPGYTLVDFDLRYRLGEFINGTDAAIQLNVTNIFDEYYIGFFGGSLDGFGFAQIGAPRAASISLTLGY
ncbi:TonB-dependent receptor [Altererythrobacter sp. ZODW24]|uniref:TonB-dependent receptor n=1 Tax=Altererythrobacter sp. ZODW24 TaxID=2185142 RepID=UPI000DF791CF|nr:TonB-dependent receptor [Altererythrobacter sp. ZODW24]